jgi:glycolate oxidase iron-sulfur subunit
MTTGRVLPLDLDELAACVSCGLCLAHCPTYRVTGEEARSPRGRIAAMRAVEEGAPARDAFIEMMYTCVGCRACETACPSSVPFGRLMEASRRVVADRAVPWWQRLAYRALEHPRLLAWSSTLGAVAQRSHLLPRRVADRMSLPVLPIRQSPLVATGSDVWLFTGCVMDAWQRPVHQAAIDVLTAMGVGVALPGRGAACCGALHGHAGLHERASILARRVMAALPGDAPVLVDSAGCGAALKEYGDLLGTDAARAFSARVYDIQEWMADRADRLPPLRPGQALLRVAVQDPCHLRHAQRAAEHVRTVLRPFAELVELTDEGRCCGAGGAFSVLQPALAGAIRDEKVAVIEQARAQVVASANPGCALWLAAAGVAVRHPVEIICEQAGLGSGSAGSGSAGSGPIDSGSVPSERRR